MKSNDHLTLKPQTQFAGRMLEFEFPGLEVGVAEYEEGPTGCTVFCFPGGTECAVDIRGGSPGSFMPGDGSLDALCFAGGSLYGLEACSGVAAELLARRGYHPSWDQIALVRGAIIYDFRVRDNSIYPDKALGRAAVASARAGAFALGARGAGRSATAGKWMAPRYRGESAGQGGAFLRDGEVRIAAFTVVNALGALMDRKGKVVCGLVEAKTGRRARLKELIPIEKPAPAAGNTTLSLVVTNVKVDAHSLRQLARQVHSSMARAIQPFHTVFDGDILYAATTNEVEDARMTPYLLGVLASEAMWDAVLSCCERTAP
jgi:L-aminopeptidase/D-esterase-like protein